MTDVQAAIGLQQLRRLAGMQKRRREIVDRYNAAFCINDHLEVPTERPGIESALHIYPLRLRLERLAIDRSTFVEELRRRQIGTSVHFIPVHVHPYYRDKYGLTPNQFPVATENYLRLLSLPLHPGLRDEDVDDVIAAVADTVAANSLDAT
jgi:dTDP-4-amino-4,6-dideoxygalactose transaminase